MNVTCNISVECIFRSHWSPIFACCTKNWMSTSTFPIWLYVGIHLPSTAWGPGGPYILCCTPILRPICHVLCMQLSYTKKCFQLFIREFIFIYSFRVGLNIYINRLFFCATWNQSVHRDVCFLRSTSNLAKNWNSQCIFSCPLFKPPSNT